MPSLSRPLPLQRMGPAHALEPPDEHVVAGLEEQQPRRQAAGGQVVDHRAQVGGEQARLRTSITTAILVTAP